MPACSSEELEPGPITLLDEDTVIGPPEPPTFTPLAKEFADHLPGFYATLDASFAALEAEAAIDIGLGIVDGFGALASSFSASVNPEALANLKAAEDGYRVARAQTAALQGNLPSDVQQPELFTPLNFVVQDAAGARVAGALVTIDADFGNGSTRSTDGNGFANFGTAATGSVAYTVARAGYATAAGVVALGSIAARFVTLEAA